MEDENMAFFIRLFAGSIAKLKAVSKFTFSKFEFELATVSLTSEFSNPPPPPAPPGAKITGG